MTWVKSINKDHLHPSLVDVMELTLKKLEEEETPFKVYSGLRTFGEQDKLYAQGRTTGNKGEIVTKARGGQSMHNYGLAVDLAPLNLLTSDPDDVWWPNPDEKEGHTWYQLESCLEEAVYDLGKEDDLEFEWGGRWKFRDVPHCQIRTTITELMAGHYPHCNDVEWAVKAHTTFLFGTPWMARRVQYLLTMQSYPCGPVDGQFGPATYEALAAFREDQKLENSKKLDLPTVERLVRMHQLATSLPRGATPASLIG